jgi:hypothetical protein
MPLLRSRTNTSVAPFVSPGTRLVASDAKATSRPSALIEGYVLAPPVDSPPALVKLARLIVQTGAASTTLVGTTNDAATTMIATADLHASAPLELNRHPPRRQDTTVRNGD